MHSWHASGSSLLPLPGKQMAEPCPIFRPLPPLPCPAAMLTVDRFGRRPLLIAGSLACGAALACVTLAAAAGSTALLLAAMCAFVLCFSLSWAGLYWVSRCAVAAVSISRKLPLWYDADEQETVGLAVVFVRASKPLRVKCLVWGWAARRCCWPSCAPLHCASVCRGRGSPG